MDLTTAERDRRHQNIRAIMKRRDVDVVIAYSDFGDQAGLQRYISNFRSSYDYMASMLYRDEGLDLIMTHPGGIPMAKQISWTENVMGLAVPKVAHTGSNGGPSVAGQIANQLAARGVKRVGVPGMEYFPMGWKNSIEAAIPSVEFVDVFDDIHLLRLVKSDEEQALVREACRISDVVWEQMSDIVKVGRKRYEVLADVEQIIRANGCEDSFNLCMALPMGKERFDRSPYSALPIEDNSVYLLEVSPRFQGYFGQQTGLVSTGEIPASLLEGYNAVNRAREAGLEIVKPGVDLTEVGAVINAQLSGEGYQPAPSFGHAPGLMLEDHHISGSSLVLEEGMTFIFHPMIVDNPAVMRADTYLITATGCERMTTGSFDPVYV